MGKSGNSVKNGNHVGRVVLVIRTDSNYVNWWTKSANLVRGGRYVLSSINKNYVMNSVSLQQR